MSEANTMIRCFFRIIIAGMVALGILSAFTFIYGYSGIHVFNASGATDYTWQPGQWKATAGEGYAWMNMDANGFNNTSVPDAVDVLLMGSSHMEAVNIAQNENVGSLLNEKSDLNIYNIGVSGHTIYNCVNNIKSALDEYNPTEYLILETDTMKLDDVKMLDVINGEYAHIPSYDRGLLFLLQKYIPAVKNIYKAVDEWKNSTTDNAEAVSFETSEISSVHDSYYDTLNAFLKKASVDSDGKLVIFYQPKTRIDEEGAFADNGDSGYRELFASACEANGIKFIDMTDDFKDLYETEHILAHGFTNTAVGEGHLNKYGHQVIAERLIEELHLTEE